MMKGFIRKIFENETNEHVHRQFVRFGKGKYEKRAALNLMKTDKIKARGSFEYANDFVNLVAEFPAKFSGMILSKDKVPELGEGKKKGDLISYDGTIDSETIKRIRDKVYFMLLDAEAQGLSLKMKKKLPKPGKGDAKVDDKFCQLEADLKYWPKIKEAFFWDLDGKKAIVTHDFIIDNLKFPSGEKDFEKIRIFAKRAGKLVRKMIVDGREVVKEIGLEV